MSQCPKITSIYLICEIPTLPLTSATGCKASPLFLILPPFFFCWSDQKYKQKLQLRNNPKISFTHKVPHCLCGRRAIWKFTAPYWREAHSCLLIRIIASSSHQTSIANHLTFLYIYRSMDKKIFQALTSHLPSSHFSIDCIITFNSDSCSCSVCQAIITLIWQPETERCWSVRGWDSWRPWRVDKSQPKPTSFFLFLSTYRHPKVNCHDMQQIFTNPP